MNATGKSASAAPGLGTFIGVFTPTILTILGVIMYLRFGWVIGQVGIVGTFAIVLLANGLTLTTTLAFSAIATNSRVGVGGAYYIVSRSLGLELGGAIGLPLFLSQVFSVTLYAFGLAESLRIVWHDVPVQTTAFGIVAAVGLLAFRGAGLALKAQIPLLALIALSLIALVAGAFTSPRVEAVTLAESALAHPTFWAVFAVFFPAVTGIMAGLGLSGDLRNPMQSIPRGALAATVCGMLVYLIVPPILLHAATREALIGDALIWTRIAVLGPWLVLPGLWGAIFSSAVGSILGAPRTLQAMARDGLAPEFLGRLSGKRQEPVWGLVASLALAMSAVLLGDLNAVAPVVTMFFLTVYGTINIVAALETLSGDPSWRPRFSVPWPICLAGGLGCFAVMLLINPLVAVAAILFEVLLWLMLARREVRSGWGDVRRGVYQSLIRWSLVRLASRPSSARDWRPHIIVFVDDIERRLGLVRYGALFSQGRGVVTVCRLVEGDLLRDEIPMRELQQQTQRTLDREGIVAFAEVDVVRDVPDGIADVSQANGLAGLDSNTILLGWPREPERLALFLEVAERLEKLNKSVVIGRVPENPRHREHVAEIHIWWGGLQRNGDLMLLLAHLLTRNPEWRRSKLRVLSLASSPIMKERTEAHLARLLPEIRIAAEADVMLREEGQSIREMIHSRSAEADVVFLGLAIPNKPEDLPAHAERLQQLAGPLRTVFFVKNSSLFVGGLIQKTDEIAPTLPPVETSPAGEGDERPPEPVAS